MELTLGSLFPWTVFVEGVWERGGHDGKCSFFLFSLFRDELIGVAGETLSKGTDCRQKPRKCHLLKVLKNTEVEGNWIEYLCFSC